MSESVSESILASPAQPAMRQIGETTGTGTSSAVEGPSSVSHGERNVDVYAKTSTSKRDKVTTEQEKKFWKNIKLKGAFSAMRGLVSKKKRRFIIDDFDLDLTYITPRIIAMGFPSSGGERLYRNPLPQVQRFFEKRHPGHFRLYNLCSERAYDPCEFDGNVVRFPFDDHNPPPLALIPAMCQDIQDWLDEHPENVVAIHCKAGKGRTGLMISAYLLHANICPTAESALRYFGIKRTANGKGVTIPSQMRYVHYYEYILRRGYPVTYTYKLNFIRMRTIPTPDMTGFFIPWFTVSSNGKEIFDWREAQGGVRNLTRYKRSDLFVDFDLSDRDVIISGDVKIQFYRPKSVIPTSIVSSAPAAGALGLLSRGVLGGDKALCHIWFHTAFVEKNYLVFSKAVIDKANKDNKGTFHPSFSVELYLHRCGIAPGQGIGPSKPMIVS